MRYTTLALCLFLFGNSWAQKAKPIIVHNNAEMLIDNHIFIVCHNDGITIYNCDTSPMFLEARDTKRSYPISFFPLAQDEYRRLYSHKGKRLYISIGYNMGNGKKVVINFQFKRPPRKHRVVFFYDIFLSISASLSAIYCLSAALLKKYTYSAPHTIKPSTI